jgi:magnesium and cobalt transporter
MSKIKFFKDKLRKHFFIKPKNREELLTTIRSAEQEKILDREAEGMLEGVLQVSQMQIRDIMIPPSQMIVIEHSQSFSEILATIIEAQHSRYPVIGDNKDEVIGILLAKDLLAFIAPESQGNFSLKRIMQPTMIVPETQHLDKLLKSFKTRRSHMAIVMDEFGHIAGLVTMEDVLEQIVGDIEDETDYEEDDSIKAYDDYYIIKADIPLEEFDEYFKVRFNQPNCESIAGVIIKHLGYIPKRNEEFTYQGFHFKVLHADKRRIRLLQVERVV